jgi:hypothetical protein
MKLKLAIDPDLVALMQAEIAAGEKAVTAAMREAGTGPEIRLARPDHRRGAGHPAGQLDPLASFPNPATA